MLPLFESWSLLHPKLPARSELYSLELIGVGTAFVESLSGYVARLADVHSLSVGDLVGRLLSRFRNPHGAIITSLAKSARVGGHGFHACGYAVNGASDKARQWVYALESATSRRDLHCLTLLPFRNVLPDHLFRHCRASCAVCFDQWRATAQTTYEPLLWAIAAVSYCAIHARPLDCTCHHCAGALSPLGVFSRPGYCQRCNAWLGMPEADCHRSQPGTTNIDDEIWATRQVGDLLAMLPYLDAVVARESLRLNLVAYLAQVADGNVLAMSEHIRCPPAILQDWLSGKRVPRLESLLRTCRSLDVPVSSLFTDLGRTPTNICAAKGAITRAGGRGVSPSRPASEIQQALLVALREDEPRSLSQVAKTLGYTNTERLYQADRKLCHEIASRYRKSGRSHWWKRPGAIRICETARLKEILEQSIESGTPTSPHQIALNLGYSNDGYIQQKFPELCRAIRQKIDHAKQSRPDEIRSALEGALRENPPPYLSDLARRLGYSASTVLRAHAPHLCDRLRSRYRRHVLKRRADLESKFLAALEETPVPSVNALCRRLDITRWFTDQYFPETRNALAARRRQWVSAETKRRRERLFQDVRDIAVTLQSQGLYPSTNRIIGHLPIGSSREWKAIDRAVRGAHKALGISK
ncbi:MAG: TniQ family protein [Acidobacteriaceae bacterium]